MADVVYVQDPVGFNVAFKSWNGEVGRYLRQKTEEVRVAAVLLAPGPAKSPVNRSSVNWSTGRLEASITTDYGHSTGGDLESTVTANAPYALMVHEGTRRHVILPKPGRTLRFRGRTGDIVFAPRVDHPGTAANPFLSKALETVMGAI